MSGEEPRGCSAQASGLSVEQPWWGTPQGTTLPRAERLEATVRPGADEEDEESTASMHERERLIDAAIATQALAGIALPRDIAEEAFAAAQRRPPLDLR